MKRSRLLCGLSLALLGASSVCRADAAAKPTLADAEALSRRAAEVLDRSLTLLANRQKPDDKLYYEDGVWHTNHPDSWASDIGAAAGAAALWRYGNVQDLARREQLHRWAVDTIDRAVNEKPRPDGGLGDKDKPETMFGGCEIAATYLDLGDSIDEATKARWRGALVKAVDFMVAHHDLSDGERNWYTNGNIELGELELLQYVYDITKDEKYKPMIEAQWQFLIKPPAGRWEKFGLVLTKEPTKEDGSDGAGYLCESGGKEPGFDGSYTLLQTVMACRLYINTHDPRYLRLVNLFVNTSMQYLDQRTFIVDTTNGTRRNNKQPYMGPGLAVAGFLGNRPDLAALTGDQFTVIDNQYKGATIQRWAAPSHYRSLGMELAVFIRLPDEMKRMGSHE